MDPDSRLLSWKPEAIEIWGYIFYCRYRLGQIVLIWSNMNKVKYPLCLIQCMLCTVQCFQYRWNWIVLVTIVIKINKKLYAVFTVERQKYPYIISSNLIRPPPKQKIHIVSVFYLNINTCAGMQIYGGMFLYLFFNLEMRKYFKESLTICD